MAKPRHRKEKQRAKNAVDAAHVAAGVSPDPTLAGGRLASIQVAFAERFRLQRTKNVFRNAQGPPDDELLSLASQLVTAQLYETVEIWTETQVAAAALQRAISSGADEKTIERVRLRLQGMFAMQIASGRFGREVRQAAGSIVKLVDTQAKIQGDAVNGELQLVAHNGEGMDATFREEPTVH